ncbi:MAG: FtsX-like permease family protein, partial [Alphaproteobacteria bacterium]|nr:FtsX-like permease family protein [Alphaproteobacteria bacterium]
SMQYGSYDQYIKNIVHSYSGDLQVHKTGYSEDKTINNSMEYTPEIQQKISRIKTITNIASRIETYALASGDDLTKGVMVMGISPSKEDKITSLSKKMTDGEFLEDGDKGVVLGSSLAKYMKVATGDTLVLLGQGYHGVSAAGKYEVKGIIKQGSPDLDRSVVYMDVKECQYFLSVNDRVTSVVVMTDDNEHVGVAKTEIAATLGSDYEVKDWKEINRILLKQIDSDRASGMVIKGILYLIIGFGIFGTTMMMTLERRKEFGVLIAVGMKKFKLGLMLVLETVIIGLLGSISGILMSFPVTLYFFYNPIRFTGQTGESMSQMGFEPVMSFTLAPSVFYTQAFIILVLSLFIGLYPIAHISKLKVSKALHSQ